MRTYDEPSKDSRDDDIVAETLVENSKITIKRLSSRRQQSLPRKLLGGRLKNNFLLLLNARSVSEEEGSKPKKGGTALLTTEKSEGIDLTVAEEGSTWLVVQFDGKVEKGLFPSPDTEVLSRIKQSIKRNIIPRVESLAESKEVRIERIAAFGKTRSAGSCEMGWNQFVLVLEGQVNLALDRVVPTGVDLKRQAFEGRLLQTEDVSLDVGDYIVIPAMTRGRLDATKADGTTQMLSIYFGGELPAAA